MSNFALYLIGTILVVAGLAWGAAQLGIPQIWIIIGAVVIIGLGIMGGVSKTRQKEKPD
jgi:NADH:ubiquinone oxidoreductase subunit 6 (subunit J)